MGAPSAIGTTTNITSDGSVYRMLNTLNRIVLAMRDLLAQ